MKDTLLQNATEVLAPRISRSSILNTHTHRIDHIKIFCIYKAKGESKKEKRKADCYGHQEESKNEGVFVKDGDAWDVRWLRSAA